MIRITVELVPKGVESAKRTIATMDIANDSTGTDEIGNYRGTLHAEYTGSDGRKGYVRQFKRQHQSVWSLVGAFLKLWGHTSHSPKLMSKESPQLNLLDDE
ncbi:MAG: hypothetical protein AAFX93_19750 [Verrucomicrobiota bacterium]